jgi:hypothetical protein
VESVGPRPGEGPQCGISAVLHNTEIQASRLCDQCGMFRIV